MNTTWIADWMDYKVTVLYPDMVIEYGLSGGNLRLATKYANKHAAPEALSITVEEI